jgi:3-hydroxyacyl-CoA dehydrogenase/enoyl-CoA hydratase/3-hydroxybutyryl-CoA epimerase
MIHLSFRDDGVALVTLDDPDRSVNAMNQRYVEAMDRALESLEEAVVARRLTGVVVTSGKDSFFVGMDLGEFMAGGGGGPDPALMFEAGLLVKRQFRRLETLGVPVVAAMTGTALGGGLELALACHYRIAVDSDDARYGLPEVTLGLLPAGGGVTRVTRMLGLQDALTNVLLQGQRMRAGQAKSVGIVDEVVSSRDELLDRALAWIRANPSAAQPWDRPGYRMPGGRPTDRSLAMMLPAFPANLRKQLRGAHYPAPVAIMSAAVEGASVDFDTAARIESRWFVSLVGTPVQRNLTNAFFFDLQHVNRGGSRPAVSPPPAPVTRVGVIGAGMMGAGIAYACARAGLSVVLVDVSVEAASRGVDVTRRLMDRAVARGRSTVEQRDAVLARIAPTDALDGLAGCDAVIEAVFEDAALKREVFGKVAAIVGPAALLASNTSSLPITSLASSVPDPASFLGLHFFSPVDRMPLVEIIRGGATSDRSLARGFDLVRTIGKTPIVVNDSRGFFTSRVFGARVMEGLAMVAEGVPAASVEQAALQAGYPVGPLAVIDEVTLTLGLRLRDEARKAGVAVATHPGEVVQERMVREFGRTGKAGGAGFYDYPADAPKRLWPGLAEHFGSRPDAVPFEDLKDRLLFAEALESLKCLREGVLASSVDGNVGSLLGIGFPPWTGGVLRFVSEYPGGEEAFQERARDLAARYGPRFLP